MAGYYVSYLPDYDSYQQQWPDYSPQMQMDNGFRFLNLFGGSSSQKKSPATGWGIFSNLFSGKSRQNTKQSSSSLFGSSSQKKSPATGWGVFSNLFSGKSRQDNRQGNVAFGNSLSRNTATVSNFNKSPVWDLHTY